MTNKHIEASLSQTDRDKVLSAIANIRATLPFLIDLNVDERKTMVRYGDKSQSFVTKATELAAQHPEILPASFNTESFKKQVALVDALYPLQFALEHLLGKLNDTLYAAGSEAYADALQVYSYAKAANVYNGALEDVVDDMSRRFARHAHADTSKASKSN